MTWLELERAGMRIDRRTWPPRISGPSEYAGELRRAVAWRIELVGDRFGSYRAVSFRCDVCEDRIRAHGGLCELCELARVKFLQGKKANHD